MGKPYYAIPEPIREFKPNDPWVMAAKAMAAKLKPGQILVNPRLERQGSNYAFVGDVVPYMSIVPFFNFKLPEVKMIRYKITISWKGGGTSTQEVLGDEKKNELVREYRDANSHNIDAIEVLDVATGKAHVVFNRAESPKRPEWKKLYNISSKGRSSISLHTDSKLGPEFDNNETFVVIPSDELNKFDLKYAEAWTENVSLRIENRELRQKYNDLVLKQMGDTMRFETRIKGLEAEKICANRDNNQLSDIIDHLTQDKRALQEANEDLQKKLTEVQTKLDRITKPVDTKLEKQATWTVESLDWDGRLDVKQATLKLAAPGKIKDLMCGGSFVAIPYPDYEMLLTQLSATQQAWDEAKQARDKFEKRAIEAEHNAQNEKLQRYESARIEHNKSLREFSHALAMAAFHSHTKPFIIGFDPAKPGSERTIRYDERVTEKPVERKFGEADTDYRQDLGKPVTLRPIGHPEIVSLSYAQIGDLFNKSKRVDVLLKANEGLRANNRQQKRINQGLTKDLHIANGKIALLQKDVKHADQAVRDSLAAKEQAEAKLAGVK